MAVSLLQWNRLGRSVHTHHIYNLLEAHRSEKFGAEGYSLGFFISVEDLIPTDGKLREQFRNANHPDLMMAFCSFKIWRDEVLLPESEFKKVLASRFIASSRYFAPFFVKKLPTFQAEKYISVIEEEMENYLNTDIEVKFSYDELKIISMRTGID